MPTANQEPQRPRGLIPTRGPWGRKLNAWRKRSPLNPYWIELSCLLRTAEDLAPHARGRLLDVGVGERPYGALFARHVSRYVGLEYPPVADNLHPEIWDRLEEIRGVVDVFGDGQRLPFRDGSFGTLLSLEVLEHVPDPDRCLAEFARVLEPGGRLLISVPFAAPLHQLPFDFYRFTPRGIETLLQRNGFEVEQIEPRGNFASAAGSTLSHYILRALGSSGRHHDGSVTLSRWRAPFVLPLIALVQLFFAFAARFSRDDTLCLGYGVVARKGAGASSSSSRSSGSRVRSQS
jgi:SAM-dependent methyltransferase